MSPSAVSLLFCCALAAVLQFVPSQATSEPSNCAQLAGSDDERLLLCQLYESSQLLAQLGALVNEGIERMAATQGLAAPSAEAGREKRKHEYLRFGKRKHEFVRFGRK